MRSGTHVHLCTTEHDTLLDVIDRAEDTFVELGLAPSRRVETVSAERLHEAARTDPNREPVDDPWVPYLSSESVAELREADSVAHAGLSGTPVLERVLTERVTGASGIILQADRRSDSALVGYRTYRYEPLADKYVQLAEADGLVGP